ncbi:MAG: acetate--CoA ligase [Pseudomonadota bacterium]
MTSKVFAVPNSFQEQATIDDKTYQELYRQSIEESDTFWLSQAEKFVTWFEPPTQAGNYDYNTADIEWFADGKLNVAYNCVDRHLPEKADKVAMIWEGDNPEHSQSITYQQLHDHVNRFANLLKSVGIQKGDRVCIYMPMIPEVGYAMLACARIGAIHSVVFGGFSPTSLQARILDSDCRLVITADQGIRGNKVIPLKHHADEALTQCPNVEKVIVIKSQDSSNITWQPERDIDYHLAVSQMSDECPPEPMAAEDPLFILYTSGSTGQPKGVMHTSGGYLVYAAMTHHYIFDVKDDDIYWCTADAGWITGHSYIFYGPLCNGATTLVFEGLPTYPDASRFWQIIAKHGVTIFYTAPTALRALMRLSDDLVTQHDRSSLRLLGTVGEPINPEAWMWYHRVVGESRCPIVDTWWQTETGGILIAPLPGATALKPGSATRPFFGIEPVILDNDGNELAGETSGILALKRSWPGQMRGVYGDAKRFFSTYFSHYSGYYFTGDGAKRDSDGYYWITGRIDDVLNVSGHRMGTAEIESALVLHPQVAEAAVVGFPHDVKGQGIYAYVTLMEGVTESETLTKELLAFVAQEISPIAKPDIIQWAPRLPKTRSGKIMRRILRKIAENDLSHLGDTSTLAEPDAVDDLIAQREILLESEIDS